MNIYKHLNLFFYRFAQILWVGGVLAFPIGLIYLIIVSSFDDTFIFDMNTFIFSILYILIPFTTGVGTQRIWPARAFTLSHLTHNDLASVRIAKRAMKSL